MPSLLPVLLLVGGISLSPLDLGAPVVDARVADVDGDGVEDVVALTANELILLKGTLLLALLAQRHYVLRTWYPGRRAF